MALTLLDIVERLKRMDEVMLLELLELRSADLVEAFMDVVEAKADKLEEELEEYE